MIEANDRVKHHWPKKGTGLTWTPGALRTTLQKHLEKHPDRDLLVVVGPLRYGLVKTEGLWLWTIRLSVGRNYERVRLDPKQVLHDVIAAGLPNDWEIYPDRLELLERTQEPGTLSTAEATLEWLDQGFSDLKRGNVLRLFFEGLEEKARARSHPAVG